MPISQIAAVFAVILIIDVSALAKPHGLLRCR